LPELDAQSEFYAQALLERTFATQQLRVSLLTHSTPDTSWSSLFECSGGGVLHETVSLAQLLDETGQVFLNVTWTTSPPQAGFALFDGVIADDAARPIVKVRDLATASESLLTVASYKTMQQQISDAAKMLQQPSTETNLKNIQNLLHAAEQINPVDPGLLRVRTVFLERRSAFPDAVKTASLLTEVDPNKVIHSFCLLKPFYLLPIRMVQRPHCPCNCVTRPKATTC
jgi:hypothetical protein